MPSGIIGGYSERGNSKSKSEILKSFYCRRKKGEGKRENFGFAPSLSFAAAVTVTSRFSYKNL